MYKEVTDFDQWFNRQLLKSAEILGTISEFGAKQKPGQGQDVSATKDLIDLLIQHEEAILKYLFNDVDWDNEKQARAYHGMPLLTTRTTSSTLRATSRRPFTYLT